MAVNVLGQRSALGAGRDELGGVRGREPVEAHSRRGPGRESVEHERAVRTGGEQQHRRGVVHRVGQPVEHRERVGVGPVQVVQDEQRPSCRPRVRSRRTRASLSGSASSTAGGPVGAGPQPGTSRASAPAKGSTVAGGGTPPVRCRASSASASGRNAHRPLPPDERGTPAVGGSRNGLGEQAALADARLASYHDGRAASLGRLHSGLLHQMELSSARDERSRAQPSCHTET